MGAGLEQVLGAEYADLAERAERDLRDHVDEINERRRNLLTVRALGTTSVSALLTAAVVTGEALLPILALGLVLALAYADLDQNRRVQAIERRLGFLEELGRLIRRALALGSTNSPGVRRLRPDLRTYKGTPSGTDQVPWGLQWQRPLAGRRLHWPVIKARAAFDKRKALGPFLWLYIALVLACLTTWAKEIGHDVEVQATVTCAVPADGDVRAAARAASCKSPVAKAPSSATHYPSLTSRPHSSCVVPRRFSGVALQIHCSGVQGAVAIEVRRHRVPVLLRVAPLDVDGVVRLNMTRLKRGQYRVSVSDNTEVVASQSMLMVP
jgi:hypothetical protein